jgi:chromate transporter
MAGKKNIAIATLMITSIGVVLITRSSVPMPEEYISTASGGLLIEGLKAGLLTFGGAYTSIPFLQNSMVDVYPNITMQTFIDGVALCNVIPAPLVIISTYLGFITSGMVGAVLMTVGIFLPAFAFTLLGHKYLEKLIEHKALHGALEGITAGVIGLLVLTAVEIFNQAVTNWQQAVIFSISLIALYTLKKRWSVPVIVLSCGIIGYTMKSYGLM